MDHHLGILQQWIQPVTIFRQRARHQCERQSRKIQKKQKEDLDGGQDHRSMRHQPHVHLMAESQHQPIGGE